MESEQHLNACIRVRFNLESKAVTKAWAELNSRECDASPLALVALSRQASQLAIAAEH
jgi:hypothetical protein